MTDPTLPECPPHMSSFAKKFVVLRLLLALGDVSEIANAIANRTGELGILAERQRACAPGALNACLMLEASFEDAVAAIADSLYPCGGDLTRARLDIATARLATAPM